MIAPLPARVSSPASACTTLPQARSERTSNPRSTRGSIEVRTMTVKKLVARVRVTRAAKSAGRSASRKPRQSLRFRSGTALARFWRAATHGGEKMNDQEEASHDQMACRHRTDGGAAHHDGSRGPRLVQ